MKATAVALLLALSTAPLAGCTRHEAPPPRPVSATVSGTIVDGGGGPVRMGPPPALPTASVQLRSGRQTFEVHADQDGRFRLTVPPGRYAVQGKFDGHPALPCNGDREVVVLPGDSLDVTVPVAIACNMR